jgi:hypothetical protein
MFIFTLFTTTKWLNPSRCSSINKKCYTHIHTYIYTMENYATKKENKFMSFAGKWMEFEIMWWEINQIHTERYHGFLSYAESWFEKKEGELIHAGGQWEMGGDKRDGWVSEYDWCAWYTCMKMTY